MIAFVKKNLTVCLAMLMYVVVFGIVSSLRHYQFQTQAWDMGIFTQTFWNTVHGNVMHNTIEVIPNHLGVHMSPILFLLVPIFYFFQSPYTLLILQTLALAIGALPVYLLSERVFRKRIFSIVFALGYLVSSSLHWLNLFDFHEAAFFVPLFLFGFYIFGLLFDLFLW